MTASAAVSVGLYAAGGAAIAGIAAAGLLHAQRRASVAVQAVIATLAPVLAVGIGVVVASSDMFISTHDLHVLFVVLTASGTVGVLEALLLGRRVAAAG